jgi:hypothetical protein
MHTLYVGHVVRTSHVPKAELLIAATTLAAAEDFAREWGEQHLARKVIVTPYRDNEPLPTIPIYATDRPIYVAD